MTFNDWLQEVEGYITRFERLQATFDHMDYHDWYALTEWLEAAYRVGYQEGRNENQGVPF
jgi:hypothetical protein